MPVTSARVSELSRSAGDKTWVFCTGDRLTRSGLSMTEWRPQGAKLPSTDAEWAVALAKYRDTPEFKKVNLGITMDEFKSIYFWEWFHRMWGRSLGVVFGVPLVYFVVCH